MRRLWLLAVLLGFALACPAIAEAQIVAAINLSSQRMEVYVDGAPVYNWPVSTARPGYRTPTGTFTPTALVRYHRSTIYSGSPMPYSSSSCAAMRSTALTKPNISGAPPLTAASGCVPRMPPRSIPWCSGMASGTR